MPESLLLLIPGLPLLAAFWLAAGYVFNRNRGEAAEHGTARVAIAAHAASLILMLVLAGDALLHGIPGQVVLFPWLDSGSYRAFVSLTLDTLSIAAGTFITLITLLVVRFSVNYLHREAGFQRFFMVLCVFTSALLFIVLSGNALLTFIGWEMAGMSSYLLIAYAWHRETAVEGGTRAFVTNRFGDTGFLFALFMAINWLNSTEWPVILTPDPTLSSLVVGMMALGLVLAALVKSAQFPFCAWITRALEGPTPSSAVFYGSLLVHAGIYLLLRIHPLLEALPALQYLLILIGILTVLYGWLGGLVQSDIKSSLIFATQQQTGLMLVSIGLGWYTLAAIHMGLHAIWRVYQFLHAPSFMHQTNWQRARPVPDWLKRQPWLYTAALQRFWLVPLENWLLVRPTQALAQEAQLLDSRFIDRLTGTPAPTNLSTLAEMQAFQQGRLRLENTIGKGSGLLGTLMEWVGEQFGWLEERLLLQRGGGSLGNYLQQLGAYLDLVDELLGQPRYLILLLTMTLVVII